MIKFLLIIAFINYILVFFQKPKSYLYCGLVGFSGKSEYNLDKIRTLLLWNSIKRGKDATGVYTPKTGILKNNSFAVDFLAEKDISKLKNDTTLIGHVRAGTWGGNTSHNAHPFHYGDIIVAHNGTLENPNRIGAIYDLKQSAWSVDSQTLAYGLACNSMSQEENYKVLGEYQGAAALLWYNEKTDLLYAYHDDQRPLFYGWDAAGNMYISSIKESLESTDCFAVTEFKPKVLYTIKDAQITSETAYKTYLELNPPKQTETKSKGKQIKFKYNTGDNKEDLRDYIGYNIQAIGKFSAGATTSFGVPMATLTPGKWYEVTGVYDEKYKHCIEVIDDDGQKACAFTSILDTLNIFPIPGRLVKLTGNIVATRTQDKLWNAGDIVEVVEVRPSKNQVCLEYAKGDFYVVDSKLVRCLDDTETEEYYRKQDDNTDNDTPPFSTESDEEDVTDNVKNFMKVIAGMETPPEEEDFDDDYIPTEVYKDLVTDLEHLMAELEEVYDLYPQADITPQINAIKSKLHSHLTNYVS